MPNPVNATRTRFNVGAALIHRVVESEEPILDPFLMFPQATPADLEANMHWLAPRFYDPARRLLVIPIQGFVVQVRGKVILVDTCVGDCKDRQRPMFHRQKRAWLDRLTPLGILPERVDYVICTHFHVDHVGWNTRLENGRWVPAFPNARYLFTRVEWEYWRSEDGVRAIERTGDYMSDSVVPVVEAGLADFVPTDYELLPEVRLIPAAGHTPGFVCVDVRSGGERLVLAGDLMHTPLQCRYPEWSTRFCTDPEGSVRTRLRLLSAWAETRTLVMPTHFPSPSAVIIERKGAAFAFRYLDSVG